MTKRIAGYVVTGALCRHVRAAVRCARAERHVGAHMAPAPGGGPTLRWEDGDSDSEGEPATREVRVTAPSSKDEARAFWSAASPELAAVLLLTRPTIALEWTAVLVREIVPQMERRGCGREMLAYVHQRLTRADVENRQDDRFFWTLHSVGGDNGFAATAGAAMAAADRALAARGVALLGGQATDERAVPQEFFREDDDA